MLLNAKKSFRTGSLAWRPQGPIKGGRGASWIYSLAKVPGLRSMATAVFDSIRGSQTFQDHIVPRLCAPGRRLPDAFDLWLWEIEEDLKRMAALDSPIIVGPWQSEVGFELLYWIPFLRRMTRKHGIAPSRIVALSRGGPANWYEGVGGSYEDIFRHASLAEFRRENERRIRGLNGQKQTKVDPFESELVARVKAARGWTGERVEWIHPSTMYNALGIFWQGNRPIAAVEDLLEFEPFGPPSAAALEGLLPDEFITAKFYFSPAFPDTPENRGRIARFVDGVSREVPVVLLGTGVEIDDHRDWLHEGMASGRVIALGRHMRLEDNLALQSAAVSRSRMFVGTYGGFSYLAPLYGIPSVAVFSNPESFQPLHLEVAMRVFRTKGFGRISAVHAADLDTLLSAVGGRP